VDDAVRAALAGRSVFVTGHTGFKGSWLSLWLDALGAQVTGYALDPPTNPSNFELAGVADVLTADHRGDIRDRDTLEAALRSSRPDVILHLAAQSVVLESYIEPSETFSINVMGTAVLLDAVKAIGRPAAVVVVTSDKCYDNDGAGRPFDEGDALGGHDPYSASKAGTELVAAAYRSSFFPPNALGRHGVALATARAGNVIGGGDWTADGLIADTVRALGAGEPIRLRHPAAVRPWQHVLEPLDGYLTLAARLLGPDAATAAEAWNFGPDPADDATVATVIDRFLTGWGDGAWVDGSLPDDPPEAEVLRLSVAKAHLGLGWQPTWRLAEAIARTVGWYRDVDSGARTARAACLADLADYAATSESDVPE
jgi:CDP-glucose 4,6-dehydratase